MRINGDFDRAYRAIEARMKERAESDGDIYIPNPQPTAPVNHVLVCMEPSLGRWARSASEARSKVKSGFRNFLSHIDTMILHFCVRHYLCKPAERYHITDLSKGAMHVHRANVSRYERYDRWYPLLEKEINLVAAPNARIIAVGKVVSDYLEQKKFARPVTPIIHYSGLAGSARNRGIVGQEDRFQAFANSVELMDLIATAENVFNESGVPFGIRDEALRQLAAAKLTLSRKKLIFNYKLSFDSIRAES